MNPLAPTGPLRAGVVQAPTAGVFFVHVDDEGVPRGVTVDLATALAKSENLELSITVFPASGECTAALAAGAIDVAFMPVDATRAAMVAFGPAYYLLESTWLVSAASGIQSLAEVDQPHIRAIGVADTTTIRAAARSLTNTVPQAITGVETAIAAFRAGHADAIALSRDSLAQIQPSMPGSRITPGGFQQTTISIAVPKQRPEALAKATAFLEHAKQTGLVRRAFDAIGLPHEAVAA